MIGPGGARQDKSGFTPRSSRGSAIPASGCAVGNVVPAAGHIQPRWPPVASPSPAVRHRARRLGRPNHVQARGAGASRGSSVSEVSILERRDYGPANRLVAAPEMACPRGSKAVRFRQEMVMRASLCRRCYEKLTRRPPSVACRGLIFDLAEGHPTMLGGKLDNYATTFAAYGRFHGILQKNQLLRSSPGLGRPWGTWWRRRSRCGTRVSRPAS